MRSVSVSHVVEGLRELSDREFQLRVWTGRGDEGEMSSFVEAVETLYSDSGLSDALDREQVVFDENLDEDLRRLGDLVVRMDGARFTPAQIEEQDMNDVRELAQMILTRLGDSPR